MSVLHCDLSVTYLQLSDVCFTSSGDLTCRVPALILLALLITLLDSNARHEPHPPHPAPPHSAHTLIHMVRSAHLLVSLPHTVLTSHTHTHTHTHRHTHTRAHSFIHSSIHRTQPWCVSFKTETVCAQARAHTHTQTHTRARACARTFRTQDAALVRELQNRNTHTHTHAPVFPTHFHLQDAAEVVSNMLVAHVVRELRNQEQKARKKLKDDLSKQGIKDVPPDTPVTVPGIKFGELMVGDSWWLVD